MSKRQKFVLATVFLAIEIIASRAGLGMFLQWRFRLILFALSSFIATIFALKDEDFSGLEWLTLPILPVMFALACVLIFPLFPSGFDTIFTFPVTTDTSFLLATVTKILFLAFFVVGYYATLLTSNIFNIAALRTIQLLRVAHSIGFLTTVATALLFYLVIFSFHLSSLINFILVFMITLPLVFQAIWSQTLETGIGERTRNYSLAAAVILGEVAWALSFWPVSISIIALFLTAIFYELIGIIQFHFNERLNSGVAREFILVAVAVFLITVFTAQWG